MRCENSEDMTEFFRTNTVKGMMEVSEAMKPSIGILNLKHITFDLAALLSQHKHIPSVFLKLKEKRIFHSTKLCSRSAVIKPV